MIRSTPPSSGRPARIAALLGGLLALAAPHAFAATKTFTCTPVDVAVFVKSRVHVQCSPGDGAIKWFALGVGDQNEANRVLSVLSTALAAQKHLTIWYDPNDLSGGAIGCNTGDCRLIQGVRMF